MIEIDHIERKFACCKILWEIENFCLLTCKKNWEICSPEFVLRAPFLTTWKISLKPNAKGTNFITGYIERLKNDSGPEMVRANWKMNLLTRTGDEQIFTDSFRYFEKNCCYGEDLQNISDILNDFHPFEADTVYFQCLLIVSYHGIPKLKLHSEEGIDTFNPLSKNLSVCYSSRNKCDEVLRRHEEGVSSLSEDLSILFSSRQAHDVVLKIEDKNILAHKAILYARNLTLASILEKNPDTECIDLFPLKNYDQWRSNFSTVSLSFVNSDAVERIVSYLYSGNLETLFARPSVSIYECASVLDIPEVLDYYKPDELILQSTVDAEEFVFIWTLLNFKYDNQDYILSPVFNHGITDTTWRLRLLPEGGESFEEYISIFAEIVDGMKPQDVSLEFAIIDTNGIIANYRRMQKSIKMGGILGFYDFVKKDVLKNSSFLENGTFRIIFKLRQSNGMQSSSHECSSVSAIAPFTEKDVLKFLSEDMTYLFEEGKYSDAVVCCGSETYNIHRCLLATRTTDAFSKFLLANRSGKNKFVISDINPEIFEIFLRYIYSGNIGDYKQEIICDVYRLAEKFEMIDLMTKCVNVLNR